ncbi:hypothetical protein AcW1_006686 [Taiwanofungus camphoratus]|nr:hypothetical protein AcV5_009273 [Antrodia cinnamomea]KAI0954031.1 hypothetical protein AcV7_007385 [Antrodia cinnamomea]KAI0954952.1 hypothetical protein AcW1_006686 [Antrodia cinnamomea]
MNQPNWSDIHPFYERFARRRCGARLFWFVAGAATAGFWIKSHQAHEWRERYCQRACIPQQAYTVPNALPPVSATSPSVNEGSTPDVSADANVNAPTNQASGGALEQRGRTWGWGWGCGSNSGFGPTMGLDRGRGSDRAQQMSHTPPTPMPTDRWEEEKHRMQAIGKQATDTVSDLSEATLETLLSTVQALKAKLAESRAQRDEQLQQLRQLQASRDDQFKQFEEWRKLQEQKSQQEKPQARHVV